MMIYLSESSPIYLPDIATAGISRSEVFKRRGISGAGGKATEVFLDLRNIALLFFIFDFVFNFDLDDECYFHFLSFLSL